MLNRNISHYEQLTHTEIDFVRIKWIKNNQHKIYAAELSNLQSQPSSSQCIMLVHQLRLFIDNDGLFRCGGRIHNTLLTQLAKFPYLLPPKHPFMVLVVYGELFK